MLIARSSLTRAACCSSGCMISSTRCARGCRRRPRMAGRSNSSRRLGKRCWHARPRSPGRPPSKRSLLVRAHGRMTDATAEFWVSRWKRLLDPPPDAELRAARLARDLRRWQALRDDIALADGQPTELLARTNGQILTTLPGVATGGPRGFSAYTLPIERWPTPEHLYSATGLAPASYRTSTITRRGRISRQGLPEHRDALMGTAWGLPPNSDAFKARDSASRARGFRPLQARVALARNACRLCWRLLNPQQPYDDRRDARARRRGRSRPSQLCRTTAQPSLPSRCSRRTRKPAARRRLISTPDPQRPPVRNPHRSPPTPRSPTPIIALDRRRES